MCIACFMCWLSFPLVVFAVLLVFMWQMCFMCLSACVTCYYFFVGHVCVLNMCVCVVLLIVMMLYGFDVGELSHAFY